IIHTLAEHRLQQRGETRTQVVLRTMIGVQQIAGESEVGREWPYLDARMQIVPCHQRADDADPEAGANHGTDDRGVRRLEAQLAPIAMLQEQAVVASARTVIMGQRDELLPRQVVDADPLQRRQAMPPGKDAHRRQVANQPRLYTWSFLTDERHQAEI